MTDISPEAVERLANDCQRAIDVLEDDFPTGQEIYFDCIAALRALSAERDALQEACAKWAEVSQSNYQRAKAARADALREAERSIINLLGKIGCTGDFRDEYRKEGVKMASKAIIALNGERGTCCSPSYHNRRCGS